MATGDAPKMVQIRPVSFDPTDKTAGVLISKINAFKPIARHNARTERQRETPTPSDAMFDSQTEFTDKRRSSHLESQISPTYEQSRPLEAGTPYTTSSSRSHSRTFSCASAVDSSPDSTGRFSTPWSQPHPFDTPTIPEEETYSLTEEKGDSMNLTRPTKRYKPKRHTPQESTSLTAQAANSPFSP